MVTRCPIDGHCQGNEQRDCIVEETIDSVLSSMDMEVVLDRTARILRRHFGTTRVGIHLICEDEPERARVLLVDDPDHPTPEPGTRFDLAGSLCGLTVETGEIQILENLDPDQPRVQEEKILGRYGYGAVASFPLQVEERVLGTLEISHPPRHGLLGHCQDSGRQVARLIAIALNNSLLLDEVRRLNRLLDRENTQLKDQIRQTRKGHRYVAESPAMQEVMKQARMVAPSDTTVLLRGETGTGKEGLARLLHEMSSCAAGPFVVVNLGAITETLIESELFGHEKGAFTGAEKRKIGRFEQAARGTIFLDEVGDAPLPVQVKLLRALQERRIERVGGMGSIPINARVVAATNRDLEKMIEEGDFRLDLFYRLNAFPIFLPPLRDRPQDISPLTRHLLKRQAIAMHQPPPEVSPEIMQLLESYQWPGNIRELENYLQRALILRPGPVLALPNPPGEEGRRAMVDASPPTASLTNFDDAVQALLRRALEHTGGKIYGEGGAAALLGLKPTTLQGKLKKYGLR